MKILFFCNNPGSAIKLRKKTFVGESWILAIEQELKRQDNIQLGVAFQDQVPGIESFSLDNVMYYACPHTSGFRKRKIGWGGNYITEDEIAIKHYLSVIEMFKPDVIQVFGTENNYGLVSAFTKIPVVVHIQGIIDSCYQNFFSGTTLNEVKKYLSFISVFKGDSAINQYNYFGKIRDREKKIFQVNSFFIGRTDFDRRVVNILSPGSKYFHGDELLRNEFFNHKWELPQSDKLIITTTLRPSYFKGLDLIIKVSQILKSLNVNFEWNIIGATISNDVVKFYLDKFSYYDNNIKFLGNKNPLEIIEVLLKSNIYVHTSYVENSPNSVCEAMLLGMPVIASNTGGVSNIVRHKIDGMLVNVGDYYDTTGAILEILNSADLAITLGSEARKIANIRHNPKKIIKELITIYNSIINKL